MGRSELEKLEELDIASLTLGDVLKLKNKVLRRALVDAINVAVAPEHHSHGTHSNHYQSIAIDPSELELRGPGA